MNRRIFFERNRTFKSRADELACKPDSVIWALICGGGVMNPQVRALAELARESLRWNNCGRTTDGD